MSENETVREGIFDCPARRWKSAMDGEAKGASND